MATWLYSLLFWLYIVADIIILKVNPLDPFIYWIPISFYVLGIVTFVTSFASMVVYLTFWWGPRSHPFIGNQEK
jgi:hypothetical protein